ncbi:GNAT family N-acetyltransferase [Serinicoccus marinus]|uniref:GNAT family N-acetyltransferase n=1 Tax=Serinicoccus marinus TaxID=247333 RepID=UPI00122DF406
MLVVHALGVCPAFLRQGVTRFLVDAALEVARGEGCRAVRLDPTSRTPPLEPSTPVRLHRPRGPHPALRGHRPRPVPPLRARALTLPAQSANTDQQMSSRRA